MSDKNIEKGDLVLVHRSALTYSMTGQINPDRAIPGLVLFRREKRKLQKEDVNFDNSAIYYVMTNKGCMSIFEFDLEVLSGEEKLGSS